MRLFIGDYGGSRRYGSYRRPIPIIWMASRVDCTTGLVRWLSMLPLEWQRAFVAQVVQPNFYVFHRRWRLR
jgi:hypothetical protein